MAFCQTHLPLASVMPIVSFIVTYYSEPLPLLAECLRSVLQVRSLMMQRGMAKQDFEIVVVDDGSRLSPLGMLKQMDEDICYIRQANAGLSAARNAGLAAAHGEYVQFVDADDALLPHAYCSLCPQSREEADIILFRFTSDEGRWHEDRADAFTDKNTSPARPAGCRRAMSGTQYMLHHNVRASACCYLFRRSLLGRLRFADGLLHEDELFTPLLLLRMHSVRDYTWPAYYYRQRPHTITHTDTACHIARRLNDTETILHRLRDVANHLRGDDRRALMRRVEQLTTDYIYIMWKVEADRQVRMRRMRQLAADGLLPLPLRSYTLRHWAFCLVLRLPHGPLDVLARAILGRGSDGADG